MEIKLAFPTAAPNQVVDMSNNYLGHLETNAVGDTFVVGDDGSTKGIILDGYGEGAALYQSFGDD